MHAKCDQVLNKWDLKCEKVHNNKQKTHLCGIQVGSVHKLVKNSKHLGGTSHNFGVHVMFRFGVGELGRNSGALQWEVLLEWPFCQKTLRLVYCATSRIGCFGFGCWISRCWYFGHTSFVWHSRTSAVVIVYFVWTSNWEQV